jgi:hypothetical protein
MATNTTKKASPATAPVSTQVDPQKEAIFACIQAAFLEQGLTPITSPLNQIVWTAIPKPVVIKIGTSMRKCIKKKLGKDPGDLTGPLLVLGAHEPVMTVATLIEDLAPLVA